MSTVLSDRCPKCGKTISYTPDATKLLCPCGHSFLVVEFASERLKMEQAQEDKAKAQERLAATEAEKAALQARLNNTLTALEAIEGSQAAEDMKLEGILNSLKADRQTHEAMTELLRSIQQEQQSGQDALSQLMRALMKEQNSAAGKLSAVQELSAHILTAQKSGAESVEQMQDEILERIDKLDMKTRDRIRLSNDFCAWSKSMQKADVRRLQTLQSASDTLLQGQKQMTAKLDALSDTIAHTRDAVSRGFDELRRQRLDTLIELYHQATGLQLERNFDKAEEKYRDLLAKGGADAQDAEIYWRMLLCHYGVEYQEENGKTIPIILRPDLTDPSTMQVRKDLFAHIKEEQRAHYTERLEKIDSYLNRYRAVRLNPAWAFDVFISVKQSDQGHYTEDSDRAADLYNYFIQDPALAAKKLRVFNSRYTQLPVGEEYEPYIIAALMSAKVLIVVGSTPEYMNSQWVKNEWSRFQYLQDSERKQGKTDRRLFCYLTGWMKPEKLPQALNPERQVLREGPLMGSILHKIMDRAFPGNMPRENQHHVKPSSDSPGQIAVQMETWLELGMYQKVIEKKDSILDARPEMLKKEPLLCLYALCAQRQVWTIDGLAAMGTELCADPLYKFSYKYADASLRARLDALWPRKDPEPTPQPSLFTMPEPLGNYRDSMTNGYESAALHNEETAYQSADALQKKGELAKAAIAFGKLGNYKDAKARSFALWDKIAQRDTIAASTFHTIGLKSDGTAMAVGKDNFGECEVSGWKDIVAISTSMWHTVGLKSDGTVVAVGDNDLDKCQVSGWKEIVAISASGHCTIGLKSDGTVVAVGFDAARVSDWKDIVAISAGDRHTVGLKSDGTVVAVGDNDKGQCDVSDWKDIVAISAGDRHTVGLKSDGTVMAVGWDSYDQCKVSDWKDIVAVSTSMWHTAGLKSNGTVVAVGWLSSDQRKVSGWTGIVAISVSKYHVVGLKSNGTVVAVGDNEKGQCDVSGWKKIKLPQTPALPSPERLGNYRDSVTNVYESAILSSEEIAYQTADALQKKGELAKAAIAFGKLRNYKDAKIRSFALWDKVAQRDTIATGPYHTVGLKSDGTVVAVGKNSFGQCNVSDWKDIVAISAGFQHTIGLRSDGTVVAVGENDIGQCNVSGWKDIVAISAGYRHTAGLKSDGTVVVVEQSNAGQYNISGWKDIVAISAGNGGTIGLKSDGTVIAAGAIMDAGKVSDWKNIVAISVNIDHTVGLKSDGTVVAAGYNDKGQCDVSGWKDIVAISAGAFYTVGQKSDGTVMDVGRNRGGKNSVSGWKDIVAIATHTFHTAGLKSDGMVVAVGDNIYGQCDVSTWRGIKLPQQVQVS